MAKTFRLRFEIWNRETILRSHVREQGLIVDEHDEHARHWAAFIGDAMVAAARMCIHDKQEEAPDAPAFLKIELPTPIATINRLVVVPSVRRCGLAKQVDVTRISAAKNGRAKCIVGTAAPIRIDVLERLGFHLTGEEWVQHYCVSPGMHAMILML